MSTNFEESPITIEIVTRLSRSGTLIVAIISEEVLIFVYTRRIQCKRST